MAWNRDGREGLVSERQKRDADEGTPYVTINGKKIDARARQAIDEAFKKMARQRDRVVSSFEMHFAKDG